MRTDVFCDYDSFLNTFEEAWLDWVAGEYGIRHQTREILHWDWLLERYGRGVYRFFEQPGCYDLVSPRPGSREFIDRLQARVSPERVYILTATPDSMQREKERHIWRHFRIPPGRVIHSHEKWRHSGGGILVDDNRHNVLEHVRRNRRPGVVFDNGGRFPWSGLRGGEGDGLSGLLSVAGDYGQVLASIGRHGHPRAWHDRPGLQAA